MLALWLMMASTPDRSDVAEPFQIAITVDDLTGNGNLPPGVTRLQVASRYLRALKAYAVPEAYGFLNAAKLRRDPDGNAVLKAWRKARYPLGNHTYSHMNVDRALSLASWQADVVAGEPALERWMKHADWRWFRYPNLSAGRDQIRHDEALRFLAGRGYRIADVSVSFDDWAYSDAYARCRTLGDEVSIGRLKSRYLAGVNIGIARMRALSFKVYGRVIPQVLLTHLSSWSADMLPQVLQRLKDAGAKFIPLAQVQGDRAFSEHDLRAGDQLLMERTAARYRMDVSHIPRLPPNAAIEGFCK